MLSQIVRLCEHFKIGHYQIRIWKFQNRTLTSLILEYSHFTYEISHKTCWKKMTWKKHYVSSFYFKLFSRNKFRTPSIPVRLKTLTTLIEYPIVNILKFVWLKDIHMVHSFSSDIFFWKHFNIIWSRQAIASKQTKLQFLLQYYILLWICTLVIPGDIFSDIFF